MGILKGDSAPGAQIVLMPMWKTKTVGQETVGRLVPEARAKEKDVVTVTEALQGLETSHPGKRIKSFANFTCEENVIMVQIAHFVIQAHASNSKKENAKMTNVNSHILKAIKAKMARGKVRIRKAKVKEIRAISLQLTFIPL